MPGLCVGRMWRPKKLSLVHALWQERAFEQLGQQCKKLQGSNTEGLKPSGSVTKGLNPSGSNTED